MKNGYEIVNVDQGYVIIAQSPVVQADLENNGKFIKVFNSLGVQVFCTSGALETLQKNGLPSRANKLLISLNIIPPAKII